MSEQSIAIRPTDAGVPTKGNRAFGARRSETHTHQGIDMLAARGRPVRAVEAGTVTHASNKLEKGFSGYGRHVVVRKGTQGPWFLFAHLDSVSVRPGDSVQRGQTIGTVGNTCFNRSNPARVCGGKEGKGYHLHFEVSPRAYPQPAERPRIDPVLYLTDGTESTTPYTSPMVAIRQSAMVVPVLLAMASFFLKRRSS